MHGRTYEGGHRGAARWATKDEQLADGCEQGGGALSQQAA
jgi:hypothetical protein